MQSTEIHNTTQKIYSYSQNFLGFSGEMAYLMSLALDDLFLDDCQFESLDLLLLSLSVSLVILLLQLSLSPPPSKLTPPGWTGKRERERERGGGGGLEMKKKRNSTLYTYL